MTMNEEEPTKIAELLVQLDEQSKMFNAFVKATVAELKAIQKQMSKKQQKKQDKTKKVVDPDAPKKTNVFEIPVAISDELATFIGTTVGEYCSRQQVTNSITAYVKENNLQNPENKRYILLDGTAGERLKELLQPDQPLTFFNMQRYLKPHYLKSAGEPKKVSEVEPVVEPVVEPETLIEDTKKRVRRVTPRKSS
jgi:upstream activation factor subunit UAF30